MQNKTRIFVLVYNDRLHYNVMKSLVEHQVTLTLKMHQYLTCRA